MRFSLRLGLAACFSMLMASHGLAQGSSPVDVSSPLAVSGPSPAAAEISSDLQILKIYIDPLVEMPEDIFFRGPGQLLGRAFGVAGKLASAGVKKGLKGEMLERMEKEHIVASEILLAEAQAEAKQIQQIEVVHEDPVAAKLTLSISMYGFNKTHIISSKIYPLIRVLMILRNANGDIIWEESELVSSYAWGNDQGFPMETYLKEPDKIRLALTKVSHIAVERLFKSLQNRLSKQ